MDAFNAYATYLLKRPYDSSLEDHVTMYDSLPYERDYDMCNGAIMVSGNIIKFFRCSQAEPFTVSNRDHEFDKIIKKHLLNHKSSTVHTPDEISFTEKKVFTSDEEDNTNDM